MVVGMTEEQDYEAAYAEAVDVIVAAVVRTAKRYPRDPFSGASPVWGAEPREFGRDVLDALLIDHPDLVQRLAYPPPKRLWIIPRTDLTLPRTPWFMRAGDEYGNRTVAVYLPWIGQLVLNTTVPMRRLVDRPGVEPSPLYGVPKSA